MTENPVTAKGRYEALKSFRDSYETRAEEAAKLTIPGLFPPDGHGSSSPLPQPWQSVGAQGTNSLAAKVLMALIPPGGSFFRLTVDDYIIDEMRKELGGNAADVRATIETALGKIERAVMTRLEQGGARAPLHDALRHLIVTGNAMIQILPKGKLKVHYLRDFVVKRDLEGNPIEMVVVERLSYASLPAEVRAAVEAKAEGEAHKPDSPVEVYSWLKLEDKVWSFAQEALAFPVGTPGKYPKDSCPFIPLRWSRIDGEDYGRGHVEEYIGDLSSLESLSQSIVELAAIAANVKFFVDPNGVTRLRDVSRAKNGEVLKGNAKDISSMALEKYADFQVAKSTADGIERRISQAFLHGAAAVRDAERVTAEEIQLIARELEQSLGGLYSTLSAELLLPLVNRTMYELEKEDKIPTLPSEDIKPSIVVGMEALGRGSDLVKLDALLRGVSEVFGPEAVAQYINPGTYVERRAAALGIDVKGLVRTPEEIQQTQQQDSAKELLGKLGPKMIDANMAQQQTEEA
jgi:hypothetical protein